MSIAKVGLMEKVVDSNKYEKVSRRKFAAVLGGIAILVTGCEQSVDLEEAERPEEMVQAAHDSQPLYSADLPNLTQVQQEGVSELNVTEESSTIKTPAEALESQESRCDEPDTPHVIKNNSLQYPALDSKTPALSCLAEIGAVCIDAPNVDALCIDFRRSDIGYNDGRLTGYSYLMIGDDPENYKEFYDFTLPNSQEVCHEYFNRLSGLAAETLNKHTATENIKMGYAGWTTNCLNDKARAERYGVDTSKDVGLEQ